MARPSFRARRAAKKAVQAMRLARPPGLLCFAIRPFLSLRHVLASATRFAASKNREMLIRSLGSVAVPRAGLA